MASCQTVNPPVRVARISRPPIPREHGAWAILYTPYLIGTMVAGAVEPVPSLLLLLAITAVFLAREPATHLLRRRRTEGAAAWLATYGLIAAVCGAVLILYCGRTALLQIGAAAGLAFGLHAALQAWPARKRLDRSLWGEMISVAALTLTAPAAYAVVRGNLDGTAAFVWAACLVFFWSGILHVKMFLAAVRIKGAFTTDDRRQVAAASFAYHVAATILVAWAAYSVGGPAGGLIAVSYLPVFIRAFYACATVTNALPSLKRVGVRELAYSVWFTILLTTALLRV
jgi:hypothetical protein